MVTRVDPTQLNFMRRYRKIPEVNNQTGFSASSIQTSSRLAVARLFGDVADGTKRRCAELAHAFGDWISGRINLVGLFVEQQVIIAEIRARNVPMEILDLNVERKQVGEKQVQCGRDVAGGVFREVGRSFKRGDAADFCIFDAPSVCSLCKRG
jgi:hypothetical protein